MILFALVAQALAGQWLPLEPVALESSQTYALEQKAGQGLLLQLSSADDRPEVTDRGVAVPLWPA